MKRIEFRELLRENLHIAVHEALKVTTDMREFFKYISVISILVYLNGNNAAEGKNNLKYANSYPMN